MKRHLTRTLFILCGILSISTTLCARNLEGTIVDKDTKEPLIGASIQVKGTNIGTVTDIDGNFIFPNLENTTYTFTIRYIGYTELQQEVDVSQCERLNIEMKMDGVALEDIHIAVKKNTASEVVLAQDRRNSSVAVEQIGSQELGRKGAGNVEDGVKKITGISIAEAGQVVVRGLGDRYSLTTLNGMPIASPNPDNKLIPLDLFPTSVVNNITVNKVYSASQFADYSGAHIDIKTVEHTGQDISSIGIKTGVSQYAIAGDMLFADTKKGMFSNNSLDQQYWDMTKQEIAAEMRQTDIFASNFNIDRKPYLPTLGFDANTGQTWVLESGKLSLVASLSIDNSMKKLPNNLFSTLNTDGMLLSSFSGDKYVQELNTVGLASLSYAMDSGHNLSYTFLYARKAESTFSERDGIDSEGNLLRGSNSSFHVYSLMNNQLQATVKLSDLWDIKCDANIGYTQSMEPDRRQVMYRKNDDGKLSLFKLNAQETMRYFGDLQEWEGVGNLAANYRYGQGKDSKLVFGAAFKYKNRDYKSMRFYYNLRGFDEGSISDIYDKSAYLNQENITDGTIKVIRDKQPKDSYLATTYSAALYAETDFLPIPCLLINFGLRGEYVRQWVDYSTDGGILKRATLSKLDLFPAINFKFEMVKNHLLRASVSRTVTRPSFIEMAPFLYNESYGGAEVRGNAELQNGYNYNVDLKYEWFISENALDLFSVNAYFKYLDSPIERVQESSGGAAVHSFRNSNEGIATGVELELKKKILQDLSLGANFSYMYTNVKLPEGGGIYTSTSRALQGASPYLANLDLSYSPTFREKHKINLSIVYNLQGPRIHAVGIMGLGDVTQKTLHSLDFIASYMFNNKLQLKLNLKNLLNTDMIYEQYIPKFDIMKEVERNKRPIEATLSVSYKLYND